MQFVLLLVLFCRAPNVDSCLLCTELHCSSESYPVLFLTILVANFRGCLLQPPGLKEFKAFIREKTQRTVTYITERLFR